MSKTFGTRAVLDDVSFDVRGGSGFIILGRSGTGKSVTLRHIVRLMRPDRGRVFVGADEISALDGPELSRVRRKIGFLFQNAALFDSISVGENVAFPLRRHTRLQRSGDHGAGDRGSSRRSASDTSTTRCRRRSPVACASAPAWRARMALDPPIVLVDEPSAGLDPITADEIDTLLLELKERGGTTLIVVTHNIPSAKRLGDELVMLHEGRIVAQGTPADLEQSTEPHGPGVHVVAAFRIEADGKESTGRRWPFRDRWRRCSSPRVCSSSATGACCSPTRSASTPSSSSSPRSIPAPRCACPASTPARSKRSGFRRVPPGAFRVRMRVRSDLRPLIRTDSIASIQNDGLVGNKFVQIQTGTDAAPASGGPGHDSEPRALRHRRPDARDERDAGDREQDARGGAGAVSSRHCPR